MSGKKKISDLSQVDISNQNDLFEICTSNNLSKSVSSKTLGEGILGSFTYNNSVSPNENIFTILSNLVLNSASAYNNQTTYNLGHLCTYQSKLYKCIVPIDSPEDFNISHWLRTSVSEVVNQVSNRISAVNDRIDSSLSNFADEYDSTSTYVEGDYAIYNDKLYIANQDISVPEDFDDTKWDETNIVENLGSGGVGQEGTGAHAELFNSYENSSKNVASGEYSHAEGCATTSNGDCSHAEGSHNLIGTSSYASHAEGGSNTVIETYSHAEGVGNFVESEVSHAEGSHSSITGTSNQSHVEGERNLITNSTQSHSEGYQNTLLESEGGHTEGYHNFALGKYVHVEGTYNTVTGNPTANCAHAEGYHNFAMGEGSHAEGYQTTATGSGFGAHSEGYGTLASTNGSNNFGVHSEGSCTTALGEGTHAEGRNSFANGFAAHAEGSSTSAISNSAHAEGAYTYASGAESHSEGTYSYALGTSSHAEGHNTTASGNGSHSEGNYTSASVSYSHAEGHYNNTSTPSYASGNLLHMVGNGTSSARNNAFAVSDQGDIFIGGKKAFITGANDTPYRLSVNSSGDLVVEGITSGTSSSTSSSGSSGGGINYSLQEQDTGLTWVDGSHIYQKTVYISAFPNNTSLEVEVLSTNDGELLLKAFGYAINIEYYPYNILVPCTFGNNKVEVSGFHYNYISGDQYNTAVTVTTDYDLSSFSGYITFQYTKYAPI